MGMAGPVLNIGISAPRLRAASCRALVGAEPDVLALDWAVRRTVKHRWRNRPSYHAFPCFAHALLRCALHRSIAVVS